MQANSLNPTTPTIAVIADSPPQIVSVNQTAPPETEGQRIMRLQRAVKKRTFLLQHNRGKPIVYNPRPSP